MPVGLPLPNRSADTHGESPPLTKATVYTQVRIDWI
jgi:hypothetical protein